MDKETFQASGDLVISVAQEVWEYLDGLYSEEDWNKNDLINSCDSAIHEIESWKKAITQFHGSKNLKSAKVEG